MSKDILKLARKCGWPKEAPQSLPDTGSMNLEEFYWGAFLAGAKAMQGAAIHATQNALSDRVFTAADAGLVAYVIQHCSELIRDLPITDLSHSLHTAPEPKRKANRLKSTCPNNGNNCPM